MSEIGELTLQYEICQRILNNRQMSVCHKNITILELSLNL